MDEQTAAIQEILKGYDQLLSAALNASSSGIVITDNQRDDNPIIYCNEAFKTMTGYREDEIIGRNCRFLQGTDQQQESRYLLKTAVAKGDVCFIEIANYRKDGTMFWNELYISPIRDSHGRLTHYVGIQNNITDRKLIQISLQYKLEKSEVMQKLKDKFIDLASHELKTPLTSLKAALQMLSKATSKDFYSSKQKVLLDRANTNANKMSSLVENLLNASRLEAGHLVNDLSVFNLSDLVKETIKGYALDENAIIAVNGNVELSVYADKARIEQVVLNLINNAVKYADRTKPVTVNVEKLEKKAKLIVQDQGIGIPADQLDHVFDRYYKVEDTDGQKSGLGLGLYISDEIIKSHNGQLGVESIVGTGSSFRFTLPLDR